MYDFLDILDVVLAQSRRVFLCTGSGKDRFEIPCTFKLMAGNGFETLEYARSKHPSLAGLSFYKQGGISQLASNAEWAERTVDNEKLQANHRENVEHMGAHIVPTEQDKDKDGR